MLMQDTGGKEDAELSEDDVMLGWGEQHVESFGHCQPAGNGKERNSLDP
jgi:hypothetical protein